LHNVGHWSAVDPTIQDMEWVVAAVVPVLSVGFGGWITYALNVRTRRRTYVEELFDRAISAVSVADASVDYLASAGRPQHLSDSEYAELQKWFVTQGMQNWAVKVIEANEALAAVAPYAPPVASMMPYRTEESHRPSSEVIALLREWRSHPTVDVERR
jgi:hypothetical protein